MSAIYSWLQTYMLDGLWSWGTGTFEVMLVDATYTPNFETDITLANVPEGAPMCAPVALTGLAVLSGAAAAENVTLSGVDTTRQAAAILILQTAGAGGAINPPGLVAYINQGLGLDATILSESVQIVWDTRGVFAP